MKKKYVYLIIRSISNIFNFVMFLLVYKFFGFQITVIFALSLIGTDITFGADLKEKLEL